MHIYIYIQGESDDGPQNSFSGMYFCFLFQSISNFSVHFKTKIDGPTPEFLIQICGRAWEFASLTSFQVLAEAMNWRPHLKC